MIYMSILQLLCINQNAPATTKAMQYLQVQSPTSLRVFPRSCTVFLPLLKVRRLARNEKTDDQSEQA